MLDGIKHFYLTRLKGLDIKKICVSTILMEGSASDVAAQEAKLNDIGLAHDGIPAGEHNGKRGYQLTFVIAYIRDIGLDMEPLQNLLKLQHLGIGFPQW